jgi:hypothetical protein
MCYFMECITFKLEDSEKCRHLQEEILWRVWRYQRRNQNPYIEEELTTQRPKEKVQKDKQRSTKHTHKTKDGVTWTPLKTRGVNTCHYSKNIIKYMLVYHIKRVVCLCVWCECKLPSILIIYWHLYYCMYHSSRAIGNINLMLTVLPS